MVTIFFSDIAGFTDISSTLEPIKVLDMLDQLYSEFVELSRHIDIFKVKTIGNAYMAVTNLVKDQAANETLVDLDDLSQGYVNIKVGFHLGPVLPTILLAAKAIKILEWKSLE